MARFLTAALAATAVFSSFATSQQAGGSSGGSSGGTTCGEGNKCPKDLPCCSQYGQCGVGAYCLGGCDPLFSNTLDSCMPAPVCKSGDFKLDSLDSIQANTKYLGDASKANWVASGDPKPYPNDNADSVLLTMAKGTVGTLLASTNYVWYGNIKATMKTSREQGVVTAFILLSDVKDEIDFEFVGTDLNTAQSNYYFQGLPDYTHSKNLSVDDTFNQYHTYEIDWTPDKLTWKIDDKELRTLERSTTWNSTANRFDYPQTPARIQLSLWPAGLPTNGKGTIDWAGGEISWDAPDVKNVGYYYARVQEVQVDCYDPPDGAQKKGDKSYIYDDDTGYNNTVEITNDDTILGSFDASGLDPKKGGKSSASSSATASATGSAKTSEVPQVPGISGQTGAGGDRGGTGSSGDGSGSGGDGGSGTGSNNPQASTFHGWSQGDNSNSGGSSGNSGAASTVKGERALQGSLLAVLVAIGGVIVL